MKVVVNDNFSGYGEFMRNIPSGLFEYGGLKLHEDRNCVKLFSEDGYNAVVKKFKKPNPLNRIVYTFIRGSKAKRAYQNALFLRGADVNTPLPIGYIDVKGGGLIKSSYLVTEYTDYKPIGNLVQGDEISNEKLFDAFVRFTVNLHRKGIGHGDYNISNVLYKMLDDGQYDFMVIDVNRMKFGSMGQRACMKNILRICTNSGFTCHFATRYAEIRGWNVYRCLIAAAGMRMIFERRKAQKRQIKQWAKRFAEA